MICGAGKQIADRWVKEVKKTLSQKISGRRVLENTAAPLMDENARRS